MSDPQQVKERSESATTGSKRRKPSRRNSVPQEKESKANERSESATIGSKKRGRKLKYTTDEERREARRQQNRNYRARRREELIKLRRQNTLLQEIEKSPEQN